MGRPRKPAKRKARAKRPPPSADQIAEHWRWLLAERDGAAARLRQAYDEDTDEKAADFAEAKLEVEPLTPDEDPTEWRARLAALWRQTCARRVADAERQVAQIDDAMVSLNASRDLLASLRRLRARWVLGVPVGTEEEGRRFWLAAAHRAVVAWLRNDPLDPIEARMGGSREANAAHAIALVAKPYDEPRKRRGHYRAELLASLEAEDVSDARKLDGPWKAAVLIVARFAGCRPTTVTDAIRLEKR